MCSCPQFSLRARTTARNAARVLRAMQLHRPVLLEGSPGVGKTSLVTALARASGHAVTRINLSEQTVAWLSLLGEHGRAVRVGLDVNGGSRIELSYNGHILARAHVPACRPARVQDLMDLLGADMPDEGRGTFSWSDGIFLKALKVP